MSLLRQVPEVPGFVQRLPLRRWSPWSPCARLRSVLGRNTVPVVRESECWCELLAFSLAANAKLQLAGLSVPLSDQLTKARFGPPVSWKFMLAALI